MTKLNAKESLQRARKLERAGKAKEAATTYLRVGQYCMEKERWKEARMILMKTADLSPHSSRTKFPLAVCEWHLGHEPQAERLAQMAASESMEKGTLSKNSARVEEEWKNIPQLRISFYESVLQVERTSATPFIGLALAWLQMADGPKAKQSFLYALRAGGPKEEIVSGLRKVAALDGDEEVLTFIGRFEKGKISEEEFDVLLSGGGNTKMSAIAAVAAPKNERIEPSVKPLGELIRDLEKEIGIDLTGGSDTVAPLVQEFRRRSQPIFARSSKARIDIATAFGEMRLLKDACDELSRIAATDRLYYEAQCLLGRFLVEDGSLMLALEAYQKCLRDGQATEEIQRESKYALLQIYLRLDDLTRAEMYLKELEKDAPDYRQLRNLRIELKEKKGSLKSSLSDSGADAQRKRRVG